MKTIEKQFLQSVKSQWAKQYPFLKNHRVRQVAGLRKDACYLCDFYAASRQRYYFFHFTFHPNTPGEFSLALTVSDSLEKPFQEPSASWDLHHLKIGTFAAGAFLGRQSFAWMLYDWHAQNEAYWKELGVAMPSLRSQNSPNVWEPSSFALPAEKIVLEALSDVNKKLETAIFPKLQIDFQELSKQPA